MALDVDVHTDALVRLEEPVEPPPTAAGLRPDVLATRPVPSTVLGLRQRLTALTRELDEMWRDSLESGDFELVTNAVEASHAVHRAILALGGCRIGGADPTRGVTA